MKAEDRYEAGLESADPEIGEVGDMEVHLKKYKAGDSRGDLPAGALTSAQDSQTSGTQGPQSH